MTVMNYLDVEDLAKRWILSTDIPSMLQQGKVYLAMPSGAPLPTIVLSRVGGGPSAGSHVPVDMARVSFSVWAKGRPQAADIAKKLVSEAEALADNGGYESTEAGGRIHVAEVVSWLWLPDDVSDTPRYVVDIRLTVTAL